MSATTHMPHERRPAPLAAAVALALGLSPALATAQHADHSAHRQQRPASGQEHAGHEAQQAPPSAHEHADMEHGNAPAETGHDHAAMGHGAHPPTGEHDHAAMGHAPPAGEDEAGMDHAAMGHAPPAAEPSTGIDHAEPGHGARAHGGDLPADAPPREPIPPVTDADRAAAFPDVAGHAVHDDAVHWFALVDRLETWEGDHGSPVAWEASGWIGTDLDRAWFRSEGEAMDGSVESASVEVLYGRAISRWWDAVAGIRHDFGEGPSRNYAAVGVIGLAPYMFEVEATAYLGESGQAGLAVEVEHEMLITNRLILQSVVETEAWAKDDPARGLGSGLAKVESALRLRYEFTRRFAPYVGIVRERLFGRTADYHEAGDGEADDTRFVIGLRTWF
jgi:copper resistance protein B